MVRRSRTENGSVLNCLRLNRPELVQVGGYTANSRMNFYIDFDTIADVASAYATITFVAYQTIAFVRAQPIKS